MRTLAILLTLSIGLNGLLGGYLAGHLSHGHDHCCDGCDCDCDACDGCRRNPQPQPDAKPAEPAPSVDELKRMRGWVPA